MILVLLLGQMLSLLVFMYCFYALGCALNIKDTVIVKLGKIIIEQQLEIRKLKES